jgi:hypothetical protein
MFLTNRGEIYTQKSSRSIQEVGGSLIRSVSGLDDVQKTPLSLIGLTELLRAVFNKLTHQRVRL